MKEEIKITKIITAEDIHKFLETSGDDNLIHSDENFAKRTIFKQIIVPGLIPASLISAGLTKMMGHGNLWLTQELKFEKPVYIGDEITAHLKIIEKNKQNVYEIETILKNQKGDIVISGFARSKVPYIKKA